MNKRKYLFFFKLGTPIDTNEETCQFFFLIFFLTSLRVTSISVWQCAVEGAAFARVRFRVPSSSEDTCYGGDDADHKYDTRHANGDREVTLRYADGVFFLELKKKTDQ